MNFLLPQRGVMAILFANYGKDKDDVAVSSACQAPEKRRFLADPERTLIGDDEHGWSDDGVFNFEGGCYAKLIGLSPRVSRKSMRRLGVSGPYWKMSPLTPVLATSISTIHR